MKQTPALKKMNDKLATRSDAELINLFISSEEMQNEIEITNPRYKECTIVKVCIEQELVRRHGDAGREMIEVVCEELDAA